MLQITKIKPGICTQNEEKRELLDKEERIISAIHRTATCRWKSRRKWWCWQPFYPSQRNADSSRKKESSATGSWADGVSKKTYYWRKFETEKIQPLRNLLSGMIIFKISRKLGCIGWSLIYLLYEKTICSMAK